MFQNRPQRFADFLLDWKTQTAMVSHYMFMITSLGVSDLHDFVNLIQEFQCPMGEHCCQNQEVSKDTISEVGVCLLNYLS